MKKKPINHDLIWTITGSCLIGAALLWWGGLLWKNHKLDKKIVQETGDFRKIEAGIIKLTRFLKEYEHIPKEMKNNRIKNDNTIEFLDNRSRQLGITLESITPRNRKLQDNKTEQTMELKFCNVTMKKTINYLHTIEKDGFFLTIRSIDAHIDNPDEKTWKITAVTSAILNN